ARRRDDARAGVDLAADRRGLVARRRARAENAPRPGVVSLMAADAIEIRVLGCLIEKQRTTPDVYPLSLNALRLACNQSTNRDPVVDYHDEQIRESLHRLERRRP